jgi:glycosyltransferase involved in cell wall biosynthesis
MVALDVRRVNRSPTGIGRYVSELVKALPSQAPDLDFILFTDASLPRDLLGDNCHQVILRASPRREKLSQRLLAVWWMNVRLPVALERIRPDLFHAAGMLAPFITSVPMVITVQDMGFRRARRYHDTPYRLLYQILVTRAVKRARVVILPSESSETELKADVPSAVDKTRVIRHGVSARFGLGATGGRASAATCSRYGRFALVVGSIARLKNPTGAVRAAAGALRDGLLDALVYVGSDGNGTAEARKCAAELAVADRLHFTGLVSDDCLASLYTSAQLMLFTSHYEGCGLPVIEAMACGTPVVAVDIPSVREYAGDAVLLAQPTAQDLSENVCRLLRDSSLRSEMIARGLARAKQFTWLEAARRHREVYYEALTKTRRVR